MDKILGELLGWQRHCDCSLLPKHFGKLIRNYSKNPYTTLKLTHRSFWMEISGSFLFVIGLVFPGSIQIARNEDGVLVVIIAVPDIFVNCGIFFIRVQLKGCMVCIVSPVNIIILPFPEKSIRYLTAYCPTSVNVNTLPISWKGGEHTPLVIVTPGGSFTSVVNVNGCPGLTDI